jgi:hypothetical protein
MAAKDTASTLAPDLLSSPATSGEVVTKDDANDFTYASRGIYVGGTGDVAAVMIDGTVLTFSAVPAGTLLPIRCKRINATNTTATLMLALR